MVWSITNNDIVVLTVAVYLGSVFSNFFKTFGDTVLTPIIDLFIPEERIETYRYGNIRYGALFVEILRVIVAIAMALTFAKLVRNYGGGVAKHLYR